MSLDFDLIIEQPETEHQKAVKLLREAGFTQTAERLSWDSDPEAIGAVFSSNITHNLNKMAQEAGIYDCLWHPEKIGAVYAREITERLSTAVELLEADPERFEKFNAANGWGIYEHFVPFVRGVLEACQKWPDAKISVSI